MGNSRRTSLEYLRGLGHAGHMTTTDPVRGPGPRADNGSPPAVLLQDLSKNFGHVQAVRHVDLTVEQGEVVAFLGPNGAGKTSTIDMILGLSTPSGGEVVGAGHDASAGHPAGPGLRGHADRGAAQGPHRRRDRALHGQPVRAECGRARGAAAGRHRRDRRPAGGQVLRRRAAAAAVRDGAAVRPGAAHSGRADHRHGRRGPPRVLGLDPPRRRPGPHGPVRHALPGGGRRLRRPDRAHPQGRDRRRRHQRAGEEPRLRPDRAGHAARRHRAGAARRARRGQHRDPGRDRAHPLRRRRQGRPLPADRDRAHDLEIASRGLEEAFLALTGDDDTTGGNR